MNHHRVTAMTRAAANPNGTRKRFMGLCSLRGRPQGGDWRLGMASGLRTLDPLHAERARGPDPVKWTALPRNGVGTKDPATSAGVLRPAAGPAELSGAGECGDRLLLGVVVVEHHDQFGHGEQVLDALAERAQLDLPAAPLVARVAAHEYADRHRVERLALAQVQHQHLVARRSLAHDRLLELVRLAVAEETPLHAQYHDAADLTTLHSHGQLPP